MRAQAAAEPALLGLVVGMALGFAAATHPVFSATADEPLHVSAGLEWWQGSYRLSEPAAGAHPSPARAAIVVDPPLARLALALGPYRAGLRSLWGAETEPGPASTMGPRDLLYRGAGAAANLASARRGVLPFLALAIVLTWATARRLFGPAAGVLAAAALACVPPVLGHGGLATTDVAFASMALLATLAFIAWLDAPAASSARARWARTAALGVALGLALATKLSTLTLLPGALAVAVLKRREANGGSLRSGPLAAHLAAAAGLAALVLWAAYRFSIGRPSEGAGPALFPALVDRCFEPGAARRAATWALGRPLPAPGLFEGLLVLCGQNRAGQGTSYLLGNISQRGFPLFFPVALVVKTPLPFVALAAAGVVAALRSARALRWRAATPLIVAAGALVFVLPLRINVGVRHVLHLYPMLAIYAGHGAVMLWRSAWPQPARVAAAALGAWLLSTPARAAPDHMAWFNALAGRHPENVLLDSDLDWGQDLLRLERALAARHAQRFSLAYFGSADPCREGLASGRWLRPHERSTGLIAISETYRKGVVGFFYRDGNYCDRSQRVDVAPPDPLQYAWLDAYTPVARVGKSILLYDIPADERPR